MKRQLLNAFYFVAGRLRRGIELWRKMRDERKHRAMVQDWDDV
jgi:hypothetical protein